MSEIEDKWIRELEQELGAQPAESRQDILRDYREHFAAAREAGRSEWDIAAKLGDPRSIGRSMAAADRIADVEKSTSVMSQSWGLLGVVKALLILAPLNFFIVLGPFVVSVCLIAAGWIVAAVFEIISIAKLFHWVFWALPGDVAAKFASLLLICAGVAGSAWLLMLMAVISTYFTRAALAYCKWNVRFVNGEDNVQIV